jgi:cytochrome c
MAVPRRDGHRWLSALASIAALGAALPIWVQDERATAQDRMEAAALMTGGTPSAGREKISVFGCAGCHTVPGVPRANALVGPPLDHMANRIYIGGVLTNTPEHMVRWLLDPPGVDPLTAMPNVHLSEADARDIAAYLYTLQ